MNDNRTQWAKIYTLHGLPDQPNRCRCGADDAFVDGQNLEGRRGPFFVWCARCHHAGPERPTFDLAIAAWNRSGALAADPAEETAP
jgi:hypothetical protein